MVEGERQPAEWLNDVQARLDRCRDDAARLKARTQEVLTHVRDTRQQQHIRCNHAEEAEALQRSIEAAQREVDGLRRAMETRGVIERAKGMVMLRERCDADQAFHILVRASQSSHRKLYDVAAAMVEAASSGVDAHA
jgi:AmiR/NasT family two-component response regulator